MKILLVGGGSGGPTLPLLAIYEQIKRLIPKSEALFLGSQKGVEKDVVLSNKVHFQAIPAAKWRRYFSIQNLFVPFIVFYAFFKALKILRDFRPNCVIGAGSFVQVPVIWAAKILKIPVLIHQQDFLPSLANILCQLAATKITVSLQASLKNFSSNVGVFYKKENSNKVLFTGNPVRENLMASDKKTAQKYFKLKTDLPTLLVLGGATGSVFLNTLIVGCLPGLCKYVNVLHATGANKLTQATATNYFKTEFISRMDLAYAAADIVLCRAGMSTLSELSFLGKVAILIPLPKTHQVMNAIFVKVNEAALVFEQNEIDSEDFVELIRKINFAPKLQKTLVTNIKKLMPHNAAKIIAEEIVKLCK